MRTAEEKFLAIRTLQNELRTAPEFTMFGDRNHEGIRYGIEILKGKKTVDDVYNDYEEGEDDDVIGYVSDIKNWLAGDHELVVMLFNEDNLVTEMKTPKKEPIIVCKKLCGDCPFANTSLKGFLAEYTIQDFIDMQTLELSFPCHKRTPADTTTHNVKKEIEKGNTYFCRGFVESIIKSAKRPYNNKLLVKAVEMVKADGLSDRSMSIMEFVKFHSLKNNKL